MPLDAHKEGWKAMAIGHPLFVPVGEGLLPLTMARQLIATVGLCIFQPFQKMQSKGQISCDVGNHTQVSYLKQNSKQGTGTLNLIGT